MTQPTNALANPDYPVTDDMRARAILTVLDGSERALEIVPPDGASLQDRIDACLRRALAGGLDSRRYSALWLLRRSRAFDE